MTLLEDMLTAAGKPRSVRNDKLSVSNHSLKDLIELQAYIDGSLAVSTDATQIDGTKALMPGVRTNRLSPGGAT